jgi:hypothetical protein
MAIYHQSVSIVQRSDARSVTAAAAYRAAAKIEDITTGLVHDYTRKRGVDYSEILSPISVSLDNEWLTNRQELWNKVEEAEKRRDAQLAREVTLAIPRELSRPEQIALVREYVQTNYVAAGMIADVNLHHLNGDNPHAHILLSMRNLQTSPEGLVEFGLKNTDWNSKQLLITQRKSWEEITNKYLADSGSDIRIDCRSLRDQGSEFIPQIHVGVHATAMHRKGITTDRRDEFERIEAANNDIRNRLETIYEQAEYTPPEPETEIDLDPPKVRDKDCELVQSIQEILGIGTKHSCLSVDFSEYRLRLVTNNHLQVYANNLPNKNKKLILDFKSTNGDWTDRIKNRISSTKYDSFYAVVEDIKTKVRDQNAKNNELCRSIRELLEIHNVKSRVFYSVRLEINRKSDKIQVVIRTEDKNFLLNKFSLENDQWIKHDGEVYDSSFVEYLLDGAKACINIANDVLNNYRFKDRIKLTNTEKNEIVDHYRRNCDPNKLFTFMRKTHPNYTIYAREKMIEDGWNIETINMILGVREATAKQKNTELLIYSNLTKQQTDLKLKLQVEPQIKIKVDLNQQIDRELGNNIDWCLSAHNLSAMFTTHYRISWDEKSQSLEVKNTGETSKSALLTIRHTDNGWITDEKDINLKREILGRIIKENEKVEKYRSQSTSKLNRQFRSR